MALRTLSATDRETTVGSQVVKVNDTEKAFRVIDTVTVPEVVSLPLRTTALQSEDNEAAVGLSSEQDTLADGVANVVAPELIVPVVRVMGILIAWPVIGARLMT